MLKPNKIHSNTTALLSGADMLLINHGLAQIKNASRACTMISKMLFLLDSEEVKGMKEIKAFKHDLDVKAGIAATLQALAHNLFLV